MSVLEQEIHYEGPLKLLPFSRVRPQMDAALFGDIDMRVQIPSSKANLLTHQHRDLIDAIQHETGVVISSLKEDAAECEGAQPDELTPLTVRGQIDSVFEAFQRIESTVPDIIVSVVASFQVRNKRDIAGIIGTRGSTVSRLEQATKCHISTPPKHDPSRVITVHGETGKQVLSCLEMLSHELGRILHPHRSVLASFMHPFMPGPSPPPPQAMGMGMGMPPMMGGMMPMYPMMVSEVPQFYPHMPQYPMGVMQPQSPEEERKHYPQPQHMHSFVYPASSMPPYAMMPFGMPAMHPQPPRHKRPPHMTHAGHVLAEQHGERNDIVSISMEFPPEKAGLVFGRGGKTLNNLKRETGTRIVVDAERGVIQIAAQSMRSVQQARNAIQTILSSCESHRLIYYHTNIPGAKTVCFQPFRDPALTSSDASANMFVLTCLSPGPYTDQPQSPGMFQTSPETESSRASSPVPFSLEESELQLFVDMDHGQLQSQLHDCLQNLKSQMGQVELLCRFGKMVFTNIPDDLVGVPFPSDAVYNIIRTRQLHYTFEGGAGIPENVIERIVAKYRTAGQYTSRSVYYLSVLADIQAVGLDRRRRLDVILERSCEQGSDKPTIKFCGVREPYLKPFKADIVSLQPGTLDLRVAVRASPRPLSPEAFAHVEQFASTIHAAGDLELEYPAKSPFRVTGCALKTVQTIHVPSSNLVLEVVQHEGQESHRRFEFTVTTKTVEDLLGVAGAGVVAQTHAAPAMPADSPWSPTEVVSQFDEIMEKAVTLSQELCAASSEPQAPVLSASQ